jgi:hypothetical protein
MLSKKQTIKKLKYKIESILQMNKLKYMRIKKGDLNLKILKKIQKKLKTSKV